WREHRLWSRHRAPLRLSLPVPRYTRLQPRVTDDHGGNVLRSANLARGWLLGVSRGTQIASRPRAHTSSSGCAAATRGATASLSTESKQLMARPGQRSVG